MSSVLSVSNLQKVFTKPLSKQTVTALHGVSFQVEAGKITGFLGANGAGKTTSIKCILGLIHFDQGEITYFGKSGLSAEAKSKIGFLPERPYFYEYLTGEEFLRFYGEISTLLKAADLRERINRLLKRVGLGHAGGRQLRSYSKGMLQRVGIAQALIHDPQLIILDEPMTGLDPDGRLEVRDIILETARAGTAVFFSSHLLPDAEQICERLVILKLGHLVFNGAMSALLDQVDAQYAVQYSEAGVLHNLSVASLADLQNQIDRLRAKNCSITSVQSRRVTLEEAFMRIGFDRKEASI